MDDNWIPAIIERPEYVPVTHNLQTLKLFLIDIETTGFGSSAEICQIAAVSYNDKASAFNAHILPEYGFHPMASAVNGYSIVNSASERVLEKSGQPLETSTHKDAIMGFIKHIKSGPGEQTILISHNMEYFDAPVLLNAFRLCGLTDSDLQGIGFADALPMIKESKHADLEKVQDFKLQTVYTALFGEKRISPVHDAFDDAEHLREILLHLSVPMETLLKHSFTAQSASNVQTFFQSRKTCMRTMESRIYLDRRQKKRGVISQYMAQKIAGSGLEYKHLKRAWKEGGRSKLKKLLTAPRSRQPGKIKSKPRATYESQVFDDLADYFKQKR